MTIRFSPQQQAIFDWVLNGSGSAIGEAVAGSGKTTTAVEAARLMRGTVAFAAYNKKIATELQTKLEAAGAGKSVRAGTFHSFGFSAWRRVAPTVKVDDKKVINIVKSFPIDECLHEFVAQAVSLAKQRAIGVLTTMDNAEAWESLVEHFDLRELLTTEYGTDQDDAVQRGIEYARAVLRASNEACRETIDFDDMIYAPIFFNAPVWQNDWVIIDEAQDTNPARRALAKKMLKVGGRVLAIGDRHQAIYGFTGADADSLDLIRAEFGAIDLPLTVTYRCPKTVVELAHQWVSHIQASESAPDGITRGVTREVWEKEEWAGLTAEDAVLCRNTKPLVELAYAFIRKGISCHVEGRDIGRGLLALANRWKVRNLAALQDKLSTYLQRETERMLAKGQEVKAEALADRVETLNVIIDSLPGGTPNDLYAAINKLFGDVEPGQPSPSLTLSTVHKSKGREWDRVYLLGRGTYMPSKYARQQWQLDQEINLMYVAVTRAKRELVDVSLAPVAR